MDEYSKEKYKKNKHANMDTENILQKKKLFFCKEKRKRYIGIPNTNDLLLWSILQKIIDSLFQLVFSQ